MFLRSLAFVYLLQLVAAASNVSVTIQNGTYTGLSVPSFKQEMFLGMPFAQPPVGDFRLAAPRALNSSWSGPRNATSYSPICIGYPIAFANDDLGQTLSEDCLTVNVIRPEGYGEGSDLPVMLWVYGGGFSMGGSADHRYNGSWIVQRSVEMGQPIIFASFNYRVSVFGFLYGQEIADEQSGNFGLLDQRKAFEWVHENIGAFGGDNSKVTLMGESAGAISIAQQLLALGGESTLFRGGILESGTALSWQYKTLNESQAVYDIVVNNTGCSSSNDTLACLRSVDIDTFIAATNVSTVSAGPVIDGHFLREAVTVAMDSDATVKVPLLLGQNTDEGSAFGVRGLDNETALVDALLASYHLTNESVSTILEHYPDDPSIGCPFHTGDGLLSTGAQDKRSLAIYGDITMHAPRRALAETMSKHKDVFSYRFDQIPDNATIETGVSHFQEVAFVFSNPLPTQNPLSTRAGDAELAQLMTSYWISFVVNQDPNHTKISGAPTWPNYRDAPKNIVFKRKGSFIEDDVYRKSGIQFINTLGAELEH